MEFLDAIRPYIDQDAFRASLNRSPRLLQLFDLMSNQDSTSETEILMALYKGGTGAKESLKQLKSRLKEELVEFVFKNGLSFQMQDEYSRQYFRSMQSIATIKLMSQAGALSAAMSIAESTLKHTTKREFTDLSLWLCRELYIYYASNTLETRKAAYILSQLEYFQELQTQEITAERYYADLRRFFKSTDAEKRKSAVSKAGKYANELSTNLESGKHSYNLILYSYLVFAMQYELKNDYNNLLMLCNEVIEIFKKRNVSRKIAIFLFDLRKIVCFIELGEFEKAENLANSYIPIMTVGSVNWFSMCMYKTLCNLRIKHYTEAYSTVVIATDTHLLKDKSHSLQEIWKIIKAHVLFLVAINKIDAPKRDGFRISKFLNETPVFSKEKRGLNIAILTIQFVFLLHQRKYSQIIDKAETLKQYCYRYLRKDSTFRPHCFIRMLLQIPRADFNRIRTERYAEPYVKKLQSVPLKLSEQSIEVEIIPYEDLWEMTLELLD